MVSYIYFAARSPKSNGSNSYRISPFIMELPLLLQPLNRRRKKDDKRKDIYKTKERQREKHYQGGPGPPSLQVGMCRYPCLKGIGEGVKRRLHLLGGIKKVVGFNGF